MAEQPELSGDAKPVKVIENGSIEEPVVEAGDNELLGMELFGT